MKRVICMLMLYSLLIYSVEASVPKPQKEFFINDYINLINTGDKAYLLEEAQLIASEQKIPVVLMVVANLGGMQEDEYIEEVYNNMKLGSQGYLVVYSREDDYVFIKLGEVAQKSIVTERVGDLIYDYFLSEEEVELGVINLYSAILGIAAGHDLTYATLIEEEEIIEKEESSTSILQIIMVIIFSLILAALLLWLFRSTRLVKKGDKSK